MTVMKSMMHHVCSSEKICRTEHLFVAVVEDSKVNLVPLHMLQGIRGEWVRPWQGLQEAGGRGGCHQARQQARQEARQQGRQEAGQQARQKKRQEEEKHTFVSLSDLKQLQSGIFQISLSVCHLVQFAESSHEAGPVLL